MTRILAEGIGSGSARDELLALVYGELRDIAGSRMAAERAGHTLQATALVHEAYLRLVGDQEMVWKGRGHFYAAAGEAMRRILIDHARKVKSLKRGGANLRVTLGGQEFADDVGAEQLLHLNDALDKLEREDERAAEVTRLRFFAGLSVEETASAMDVSERTVRREWAFARARLFELLEED